MDEILNKYVKENNKYKVIGASISEDKRTLNIDIELNFHFTSEDIKAIKKEVKELAQVDNVELNFFYENTNIEMEKLIVKTFPDVIRALPPTISAMLRATTADYFNIVANEVSIEVGSLFAERQLNNGAGELLAKIYNEKTGLNLRFQFEFREEMKSRIEKEAEEELKKAELEKPKNMGNFNITGDGPKSAPSAPAEKEKKGKSLWSGGKGSKGGGNKEILKPVGKYSSLTTIPEMTEAMEGIVTEAFVFKMDHFVTKRGSILATLFISNGDASIPCKLFTTEEIWDEFKKEIKEEDFLRIKGNLEYDNYARGFVLMGKAIEKIPVEKRMDEAKEKRVELHAHTKMSQMDGISDIGDLIGTASSWGHKAVAITDHGGVQGFPEAYKKAKGKDIKILYGVEGYFFDDKEGTLHHKDGKTNHIIIFAGTQKGVENLYELISESHTNYFHKRPRITKSLLTKHREGLVIGSACENGQIYQAVMNKANKEEISEIAKLYDYFEIQPLINNNFMIRNGTVNSEEELKDINREIIALAKELGKPVVATCDSHYTDPKDAKYREIILTSMGYKDASSSGGLYFRTTDEMLEEFSYLGEDLAYEVVVTNTNLVSDMIGPVKPLHDDMCPPTIDGDKEELIETCEQNAKAIYGDPLPELVKERLDRELNSIISNGFAVMYVSAKKLVENSVENGYLVGSRGSVGSSFAATMSGITEVNPLPPHYICGKCKYLEWGDENFFDCGVDMPAKICPECGEKLKQDGFAIRFETFLGFKGDKIPDIDLNFAGEYQSKAHKYVEEIFGAENVYKAGTIGTIADKTAFGYAMKYFEERGIPKNPIEAERLAKGCVGVRRSTGQHPGGIIVVPKGRKITEFCPVNYPANKADGNMMTTHFDFHSIDSNLLKLDILGHDVPSMIRWLELMTGIKPEDIPLSDAEVNKLFVGTESLNIKIENYRFTHGSYGIPEFGTKFVRQMLDDTKPESLGDLIRISGFSHGTDVWLNNAQEYIKTGQATMKNAISTRDDIMNYLILKGLPNKMSFDIMENVRKGKGLKPNEEEEMKKNNVPQWYIDSCNKIQYMFPRAHAAAYVVMAYRIAYFKVYHPPAFYSAYLSTKLADFNWDAAKKGIDGVTARMDQIILKGKEATKKEQDEMITLELCYEMFARGYEFAKPSLKSSEPDKFFTIDGKVQVPLCGLEGIGETVGLQIYEEYNKKPFSTVDDIRTRAKANKVAIEALRENGILDGLPETDQISFF